jgi:hypothetical protein
VARREIAPRSWRLRNEAITDDFNRQWSFPLQVAGPVESPADRPASPGRCRNFDKMTPR